MSDDRNISISFAVRDIVIGLLGIVLSLVVYLYIDFKSQSNKEIDSPKLNKVGREEFNVSIGSIKDNQANMEHKLDLLINMHMAYEKEGIRERRIKELAERIAEV